MKNTAYIAGLALILGLMALTLIQGKSDKPSIHASISDAPLPPGNASRAGYTRQVCNTTISSYFTQVLFSKGSRKDAYCDCQAKWAEKNFTSDELHVYALTFYEMNATMNDLFIHKMSVQDVNANSDLRSINYENTYGITRQQIKEHIPVFRKASIMCES